MTDMPVLTLCFELFICVCAVYLLTAVGARGVTAQASRDFDMVWLKEGESAEAGIGIME